MSKAQEATETQTEAEVMETALAVSESRAVSQPQAELFDASLLSELNADIDAGIKAASVDQFTSPTSLIGVNLNLIDAFPYEMTVNGESEMRVMFVLDREGEVIYVPQNPNSSRDRFVDIYNKVRQANSVSGENRQLTITNVVFNQLEKGGRSGNKPIMLQFTKDTDKIWA